MWIDAREWSGIEKAQAEEEELEWGSWLWEVAKGLKDSGSKEWTSSACLREEEISSVVVCGGGGGGRRDREEVNNRWEKKNEKGKL